MTNIKVETARLRSIPLFANAADASLETLAAASGLQDIAARTMLITENEPVKSLYTLLSGAVELVCERIDRRFTLCVASGVQPLMLSSILTGCSPMSARVIEPARLIVTPAKLIVELIGRDIGLTGSFLREVSERWVNAIENFKSHRLLTTSERIADWILTADARNGANGEVVMPFGKRVLASYLGMAPEQLSRHFASLASAGVQVHGRHIKVGDRAALEAIAEGTKLYEPRTLDRHSPDA